MTWKTGDRLTHRFNPELGPGLVASVDGRTVVVEFPTTGETLTLAATSDAIRPLVLRPGSPAMLLDSEERVLIAGVDGNGRVRLDDGRIVDERTVWPIEIGESPFERLALGEVGSHADMALRLDSLHLAELREADGLGSFLGGRIHLFPHQLYTAERATRADPVRWLLADEVGLGKTVEACLILNHLLRTGRADSALVVAPETLTVQWLGELWRKYHQVFVLIDDKRLVDVEKVYGPGFNPFEAHRRAVISLEMLRDNPYLTARAVEAGVDLLIVDEAHHLRRPPGHPGDPAYRAIAPLAEANRHALLLTATPLEDDAHGFFRLLQLLRPDAFPEETSFEKRLADGTPLPPCTSATRRQDIGGLPPRQPVPVALDDGADWHATERLIGALRAIPAPHEVARRSKARRIRRALASGPAIEAVLGGKDDAIRSLAREAAESDPRLAWLASRAAEWKRQGDKTLVFVAHRETLEWIRDALRRLAQTRAGIFHEELSAPQRDIEVAQFRLPGGPSLLISTECGGEGRNFEFCTRLVLFDLPWNPVLVEQRIGRLDRIGRSIPVEIVTFHPPTGLGRAVADLYAELGLFERPLGGLDRELAEVEPAIVELALSDAPIDGGWDFSAVIGDAREAYDRVQRAAYQELHRDPYRRSMAADLLERVPPDLEEQTQDVILAATERLELNVEQQRGKARYSIELGGTARVEGLPGVPDGMSFLGSFDRAEAVADEGIDFFASGHPLVEGILAHLGESSIGRIGLIHIGAGRNEPNGFGLVAIYREGPSFRAVAYDINGDQRTEWARRLSQRPLRSRRIKASTWVDQPGWPALIRNLARHFDGLGRPEIVAAVRIGD